MESETKVERTERPLERRVGHCEHKWVCVLSRDERHTYAVTTRRAHWCERCGTVEISDVHSGPIQRFTVQPNSIYPAPSAE